MKDNTGYQRNSLLFGTAYYPEYMPYDRVETDLTMMCEAGMNVVRIAESTWSTLEPSDGIYDFSFIDRVLEVAKEGDGGNYRYAHIRHSKLAGEKR